MAVDPVSLAVTAALAAAQMAITASQTIEGPRVKGTPATLADYGTPLNYFLGVRLLSCPCFFAKPITEKKKKRKGKGGKQVTYTAFGSFAIHVADQEISGILQIWFDNHLVYDTSGASEQIYPLADDYELEAAMRIYLGTEAQTADPDMEAFIEARDGADTCPAYRGTSYIYFENIPLEMLGNRYPDVKVIAYQNGAVSVAPEEEIVFVGGMSIDDEALDDEGDGEAEFALVGGVAAVPAEGDTVILIGYQSGSIVGAFDPPAVPGFDVIDWGIATDGTGFLDYCLSLHVKRMGAVPDTGWSWTVEEGIVEDPASGWICLVFRNVHEDVLDVPQELVADYTSSDNDPPNITLSFGNVVDPGTLCDFIGSNDNISFTFALKSASGNQAKPIACGLLSNSSATWQAGNFTTYRQVLVAGATGCSGGAAWGVSYEIPNGTTLGAVLTFVSERAGLESDEYDYSLATQEFPGYSWSQATGRQICEGLCDLYDTDLRPHDFTWHALPRGSASEGAIPTADFVATDGPPFALPDTSDTDLPLRVFLAYSDSTASQNPNVAMPAGQAPDFARTAREASIDMQTLAIPPSDAQPLSERWLRRQRFGRLSASFGITRQRIGIEPGDVWTPSFDGEAMKMRCTKVTVGADGRIETEWKRDDPAIASLSGSSGADAVGIPEEEILEAVDSLGDVLDLPYLVDAHDQSAPLAYLVAGPEVPGIWAGAEFAQSDTGELDSYAEVWDGIASGDGTTIGTCTAELPDAVPWVPDMGSSIEVLINVGELTAATLDELLLDETRNLAAIESGDGWELVQFMTPTLTDTYTYTITGFLRGVRGTEWAMAGHYPGDRFVLLDTAKRHTLGASEIGDEDFYVVSTSGQAVDQTAAFSVDYTGASHKPYAPVHAVVEQDGSDWVFDATRRTRLGGNTLDGQDVPLGEASESWSLDIYDGLDVVRTITGTSLPLTYTAAQQTTDFGAPVGTVDAQLYQVNPTLSLRGYPLAMAA